MISDATPIVGRTALGHGQRDSPRFEFIEDGFGAVAHELGHAFGLPHDHRDPRDIMGNGFRSIRWNFVHPPQPDSAARFSDDNLRLLLSSRYIGADLDSSDNALPNLRLRIIDAAADRRSVSVALEAADDRKLRALVFHAQYDGRDSVIGGRSLAGRHQSFTERLTLDPPALGRLSITAIVIDGGGNLRTDKADLP
jgi:hypothetical protein